MALINCSKCGNQISDKAPSCPHCGEVFAPQSSQPNMNSNAVQPQQQPTSGNLQTQAAAKKPMSNGKIAAIVIAALVVVISIAAAIIVPLITRQQSANNYAATYQPQGNVQQNQGNAQQNQGNAPAASTYSVKINVTCIENIAMNKYDVDVIIDGETIATLPHGKSDDYTVKLQEGSHNIEFSVNAKTITGNDINTENATSTLYVDKNKSVSYTVKCVLGNKIEIKEIS